MATASAALGMILTKRHFNLSTDLKTVVVLNVEFWAHGMSPSVNTLLGKEEPAASAGSIGTLSSTNHQRVTVALEALTEGLVPFVEGKLRVIYRERWVQTAMGSFRDDRTRRSDDGASIVWDAQSLLTVMWDQWNAIFRHDLTHSERSLVSELREYRNKWAHQQPFDFDDTFRILDSTRRLLEAVKATNVYLVRDEKNNLIESYVAEQVNTQLQRTAFKRNKWWVIIVYSFCCMMLIFFMLVYGNKATPAVVAATLLLFIYLIYQQVRMDPPLLYGPRECNRCHRIVYRRNCPYCQPEE